MLPWKHCSGVWVRVVMDPKTGKWIDPKIDFYSAKSTLLSFNKALLIGSPSGRCTELCKGFTPFMIHTQDPAKPLVSGEEELKCQITLQGLFRLS